MSTSLDDLLARMHALEEELQAEFARKRQEIEFAIERFNCFYCSCANGVAAFAREVAARTEQYGCPIKHARRIVAAHDRYPRLFEFGDAQAYREGLERLRRLYGEVADPPR